MALLLSGPVRAETGAAVFGSWINLRFAETELARARAALDFELMLTPVDVDGVRYYRLTSAPMAQADARALIARAARFGYAAWYLRAAPGAAVVTTRPVPSREAPGEPAATAATPVPARAEATQSASEPAPRPAVPTTGITLTSGAAGPAIEVPFFAEAEVVIDGEVDETVWAAVPAYENMRVMDPDTLEEPTYRTTSRFFYTEKGLYVSAIMEQPRETLVARLSSRDQYLNRDSYGITLDTSGEGLYGYWFAVCLGGSLMDGKVVPERSFSEQWDGPWRGASAERPDGWSVEMFLPWSMMAMPASGAERTMGFWADRKVAHMDERYGWPALPFASARFMSALQPMRLPGLEPKQQFAIFPYTSVTHDEIAADQEYQAGADLFWRPSSNLQLTATLNPDFGAVESDDVVINLTAFETFFPEKRLFFLEGNEVFVTSPRSDTKRFQTSPDGTGARKTPPTFIPEPTTLLNTRRIGGPPRQLEVPAGVEVSAVELGKPSDLLAAVKLAGQAGGLRYGVLAAAEDDVELPGRDTATGAAVDVEAPGRDFGVVRALYETSGSGRRALGYMGTVVTLPGADSMTHGIDAHLLSPGGRFLWDTQLLHSDVADTRGYGAFTDVVYTPRTGTIHRVSLEYFDDKLDISDLGFIRQNDAVGAQYGFVRATGQNLSYFRYIRSALFMSAQTNVDGFLTRMGIFLNQTLLFPNSSQLRWEVDYYPERWDDRNSRGNGMFKTDGRWFTQLGFGTDSAEKFSWSGTIGAEQEELDQTWTYSSDIGFTFKPNESFSLDLDLRFKKRDGWLVHVGGPDFATYAADDLQPRFTVDYFITARQQLRLTMQWAGIKAEAQRFWQVPPTEGELIDRPAPDDPEDFSISRLTAQFRYRWEIGPLSDLFVVYTRGSNVGSRDLNRDFGDLYTDALKDPIIDFVVVKLRYRFGT